METEHIVKAYDEELNHLNNTITEMGGLAESLLASAIQAVATRDSELAAEVIESDDAVDDLEHEVASFTVRLLALRQPMAGDLRNIVAALKIASDLERIADYAANIAKRAIDLNVAPAVGPVSRIPRMAKEAQQMIKDVLDAYVEGDVPKAIRVWEHDREVDEMYDSLFRELLTYMMEDPRSITACTHLLFIAKHIERIGDHITNIAEDIYYLVEGKPWYKRQRSETEGMASPAKPVAIAGQKGGGRGKS